MSDLQQLKDAIRKYDETGSAYGNVGLFVAAARLVANAAEIRYCLWHERRATDDSGDDDSGAIVTRFCSSQDGSHDCVVETRLLLDITEDT